MTEIVFVSNVDVTRSVERPGTSWLDRVQGVIPHLKSFLFVDKLVSILKNKFDSIVCVLFSIHVIVFEINHIF